MMSVRIMTKSGSALLLVEPELEGCRKWPVWTLRSVTTPSYGAVIWA